MNVVKNSIIAPSVQLYKDVKIVKSQIGEHCTIGDNSNILESILDEYVSINRNCVLDNAEMGIGSYINQNTVLKHAVIGKFCCISWNVTLYGGSSHNYNSPSMYTSYHWKHIFGSSIQSSIEKEKTRIGNDVWIGNGAIVINGVTVGDGAIIGAGAVITKDVPPYSVVGGVPAKVLRMRFDANEIERLLKISWWKWPMDIIKANESLLRITALSEESLQKMESITHSLIS